MTLTLAWTIFAILVFVFFLLLLVKGKKDSLLGQIIHNYRTKVDIKLKNENNFRKKYGSIENHSFLYKLDRMLTTSGLSRKFKWLHATTYIFIMITVPLITFIVGMFAGKDFFAALFAAAASLVIIYTIVFAASGRVYNQIEDNTPLFVSLLENHSKGSSDIVTIMKETSYSLTGEMRRLVDEFLINAEKTGSTDFAFDYMKDSIDNRQLQDIILNLKNCSHFQANYEEVLSHMMGQITSALATREERKTLLFSMKISLVGITIITAAIIFFIGSGLEIEIIPLLMSNTIGHLLLFVTGVIYLFVFVKLFGTDKEG